jgi:hypothetical protein
LRFDEGYRRVAASGSLEVTEEIDILRLFPQKFAQVLLGKELIEDEAF